MAIKINMNNTKVGGNVEILNGAKFNGDADIRVSMDNVNAGKVGVANDATIKGKLNVNARNLDADTVSVGDNSNISNFETSIRGHFGDVTINSTGRPKIPDAVEDVEHSDRDSDEELLERFAEGVPITSSYEEQPRKTILSRIMDWLIGKGRQSKTYIIEEPSEMPNVTSHKKGNKQWRQADGRPYETYRPNIEITSRNGKTEITVDGQKMTVDSRNAEGR